MKNTLTDFSNIMFEQLEKISDDNLTDEELEKEIKRTEAMTNLGESILKTGELQLKVMQHMDEYGYEREKNIPETLEVRSEQKQIQ